MSDIEEIKNKILTACERVSRELSVELSIDVNISLATARDLERANDWKNHRFAGNEIRFDWKGAAFRQNSLQSQSTVFQLAATKGRLLLGVEKCSFKPECDPASIILETIEGSPIENHPLKGKVIHAFLRANIEIAAVLNARRIYVEEPIEQTLPKYEALGFRTGYFMAGQTFEAEMHI